MTNYMKPFETSKLLWTWLWTDVCSWWGLVNQAAWSYSISPIMEVFRELVKHNSTFHWDDNLNRLFFKSKKILLGKFTKGIQAFDTSCPTCLQPDQSKTGLGCLLLQKYWTCLLDDFSIFYPDGWKLIFSGWQFTQGAKSKYSPTEAEVLELSWSINHSMDYVLGCLNLLTVTDHKPLLWIFNMSELKTISNLRICKLKEEILHYQFKIQHWPG